MSMPVMLGAYRDRRFSIPDRLGMGKRLFAEGTKPAALKAIDHRPGAGLTIDVYVPVGEPTFGAIGPEIEAQANATA